MGLVLHHCYEARSFRSLWLMHEMDLEFELVVHDFGPELQGEEYRGVHPMGRVPALVHDGAVLIETGAITEYLCEVYDSPLYRAPGSDERAEWLQWLHFAETIGQHCAALVQQHLMIWEDKDRSPVVMKLERRRLERALDLVEARLLGRDYLLASGFSAVDTNVGYGIALAGRFTPLNARPRVAAYVARLESRIAWQKSLPPADGKAIFQRDFYDLP